MLATQSPGDLDYRCRENIRGWLVGRVTQTTAINKLKPMFAEARLDAAGKLPGQQTGEFYLLRERTVSAVRTEPSLVETRQLPEQRILELARAEFGGVDRGGRHSRPYGTIGGGRASIVGPAVPAAITAAVRMPEVNSVTLTDSPAPPRWAYRALPRVPVSARPPDPDAGGVDPSGAGTGVRLVAVGSARRASARGLRRADRRGLVAGAERPLVRHRSHRRGRSPGCSWAWDCGARTSTPASGGASAASSASTGGARGVATT